MRCHIYSPKLQKITGHSIFQSENPLGQKLFFVVKISLGTGRFNPNQIKEYDFSFWGFYPVEQMESWMFLKDCPFLPRNGETIGFLQKRTGPPCQNHRHIYHRISKRAVKHYSNCLFVSVLQQLRQKSIRQPKFSRKFEYTFFASFNLRYFSELLQNGLYRYLIFKDGLSSGSGFILSLKNHGRSS